MKTALETLKQQYTNTDMTAQQLSEACYQLATQIVSTPEIFLSVGKSWCNYGTWVSAAFASKAYFGEELAKILEKAMNGKITHDEDATFSLSDFTEKIADLIFEHIYNN